MQVTTRYLTGLIATAAASAAIIGAPVSAADPAADPQTCTNVGGTEPSTVGTESTVCESPGNVQISATAPTEPVYPYPWDDEFYGSALIIGPNEPMHSFGGDGGGGHR